VLELKRSTVSVAEGIRQNRDNQKKEFIQPFFSTLQWVMAGNDSEGLRYATVGTPEKYYLMWVEEGGPFAGEPNLLDRQLLQVCAKERLLELIHDFVVFDAGIKKLCRQSQYFGVKAAQDFIRRREGGIIWHTQGSGKSLIMVWLAKWIRENIAGRPGADHHRPHRAGRTDRKGVHGRQRGHLPHHERRGSDREAEPHRGAPAVLAGAQVRPAG
jgi:type I restriction enzyme R subunit